MNKIKLKVMVVLEIDVDTYAGAYGLDDPSAEGVIADAKGYLPDFFPQMRFEMADGAVKAISAEVVG